MKPLLIVLINPTRDVLRIKRDLEGQGRMVTAIIRRGTDWGSEFRIPTYRTYTVQVRRHDNLTAEFSVGVAFGLSSDADLIVYDREAQDAFFKGSSTFFQ